MAKPIVAIVGRPNVLANERISIVEDIPGVTRDRLYATTEWLDREFVIIDTGGIEIANTDKIAVSIREQAQIAIREADVILFVCDARTGITDEDAEVAKLLRKSRKPIVLAVNKADSFKQEMEIFVRRTDSYFRRQPPGSGRYAGFCHGQGAADRTPVK